MSTFSLFPLNHAQSSFVIRLTFDGGHSFIHLIQQVDTPCDSLMMKKEAWFSSNRRPRWVSKIWPPIDFVRLTSLHFKTDSCNQSPNHRHLQFFFRYLKYLYLYSKTGAHNFLMTHIYGLSYLLNRDIGFSHCVFFGVLYHHFLLHQLFNLSACELGHTFLDLVFSSNFQISIFLLLSLILKSAVSSTTHRTSRFDHTYNPAWVIAPFAGVLCHAADNNIRLPTDLFAFRFPIKRPKCSTMEHIWYDVAKFLYLLFHLCIFIIFIKACN